MSSFVIARPLKRAKQSHLFYKLEFIRLLRHYVSRNDPSDNECEELLELKRN
jgi:hypothetical protein